MDDAVADLVAKFEKCKPVMGGFFLVSSDGQKFPIAKSDLLRCPYYEYRLNDNPKLREVTTEMSAKTTAILARFLKTGVVDEPIANAFEPMLLARKVQSPTFSSCCAAAAQGVDLPCGSAIDPESICIVVEDLVKYLPLRTFEHYAPLMRLIEDNLDNSRKVAAIENIRNIILETKKPDSMIPPLPVPVFEKKITVAIMKDLLDQDMVAVLDKAANKWVAVDLFGSKFCPLKEGAKQFHLSFGDYVVYQKSDTSIYIKDLKADASVKPELIFDRSKFFRSRMNELHVVRAEQPSANVVVNVVYEWCGETKRFVKKFASKNHNITSAHNHNGDLIVVVQGSKTVFRFTADPTADSFATGVLDQAGDWRKLVLQVEGSSRIGWARKGVLLESVEDPVHIGYTELATLKLDGHLVQTLHTIDDQTSVVTKIHRPVSTFIDVYIGQPQLQ